MKGRNLTVRLDEDVVRKAKILAARRGTSVSALVAAVIREEVDRDEAYEISKRRALARMHRGHDLGTGGHVNTQRADLHDRFALREDRP